MRNIKLMFVLGLAVALASISYAQQEPIKIGGLFALSGKASHIGTPTKLVAEMIVDKINAEGGILLRAWGTYGRRELLRLRTGTHSPRKQSAWHRPHLRGALLELGSGRRFQ